MWLCARHLLCIFCWHYVLGSTSQLSSRVVVGHSRWDLCRLSWKAPKCFSAFLFCAQSRCLFSMCATVFFQAMSWELTQSLVNRSCVCWQVLCEHMDGIFRTRYAEEHAYSDELGVSCQGIGCIFAWPVWTVEACLVFLLDVDVWGKFGSVCAEVDQSLETQDDQSRQGTNQSSLRSTPAKPKGETSCLDMLGAGVASVEYVVPTKSKLKLS